MMTGSFGGSVRRIAYADIVNALGAEVARSIVVACEQAIAGAARLPRTGSS